MCAFSLVKMRSPGIGTTIMNILFELYAVCDYLRNRSKEPNAKKSRSPISLERQVVWWPRQTNAIAGAISAGAGRKP